MVALLRHWAEGEVHVPVAICDRAVHSRGTPSVVQRSATGVLQVSQRSATGAFLGPHRTALDWMQLEKHGGGGGGCTHLAALSAFFFSFF